MVELKYKNWNETPINVYLKLRELLRSDDDNEEKTVGIISILTELDIDEVMDLKLIDYERLANQIMFVFEPIKKRRTGINKIMIDGQRYDVQSDFTKITTAQYLDFTTFYKDPEKYYTNILTTFILPHGKRYNEGYDSAELAKLFGEKLDIATAENASFFLSLCSMSSIRVITGLFTKTTKKMLKKEKDPEQREKIQEIMNQFQMQKKLIDGLATSMQ